MVDSGMEDGGFNGWRSSSVTGQMFPAELSCGIDKSIYIVFEARSLSTGCFGEKLDEEDYIKKIN